MVVSIAKGLIGFVLRKTKFEGVCLPPFGIYILPESISNKFLVEHERVHWRQYQRMGLIKFYFTYFYQIIRYGYQNAPMEREARGLDYKME